MTMCRHSRTVMLEQSSCKSRHITWKLPCRRYPMTLMRWFAFFFWFCVNAQRIMRSIGIWSPVSMKLAKPMFSFQFVCQIFKFEVYCHFAPDYLINMRWGISNRVWTIPAYHFSMRGFFAIGFYDFICLFSCSYFFFFFFFFAGRKASRLRDARSTNRSLRTSLAAS